MTRQELAGNIWRHLIPQNEWVSAKEGPGHDVLTGVTEASSDGTQHAKISRRIATGPGIPAFRMLTVGSQIIGSSNLHVKSTILAR